MSETGVPKEVQELISALVDAARERERHCVSGNCSQRRETETMAELKTARASLEAAIERQLRANQDGRRGDFLARVEAEVERAYGKHGREPWSRHEFFAVMLEEVDEVKDAIWRDHLTEDLEKEMVQVAAMCLRHYEAGTRRQASHVAPSGQPAVLPSGDPERTPT